LRNVLAASLAKVYLASVYIFFPLMPLLASVVFWRIKYVAQYRKTLVGFQRHLKAIKAGPVDHYFHDVMGKKSAVPQEIRGECTQCGNCCLDRQCVFLEEIGQEKYQCGIYHSPFRRLSNCGSFPLNQWDIDRYQCPGYTVKSVIPIYIDNRPAIPVYAGRVQDGTQVGSL